MRPAVARGDSRFAYFDIAMAARNKSDDKEAHVRTKQKIEEDRKEYIRKIFAKR